MTGSEIMDVDARLRVLLREDGLADHDADFTGAVMDHIGRRRMFAEMGSLAAATLAVGGVSWASAPVLVQLAGDLGLGPVAIGVATVSILALVMGATSTLQSMTKVSS